MIILLIISLTIIVILLLIIRAQHKNENTLIDIIHEKKEQAEYYRDYIIQYINSIPPDPKVEQLEKEVEAKGINYLLDKISKEGIESLTEQELKFLNQLNNKS